MSEHQDKFFTLPNLSGESLMQAIVFFMEIEQIAQSNPQAKEDYDKIIADLSQNILQWWNTYCEAKKRLPYE
jgi:hypothetical protein